jgi:HEAT repeat protein
MFQALARITCTVTMMILLGGSLSVAQRLMPFADELRSHHISTREPDLIQALRHPDPTVRSAAAGKLAEDNDRDAVPQISQAISSERVPQVRVNMAASLSQLGSNEGGETLEQICGESKINPDVRLDAARHLGELSTREQSKSRCLGSVLMLLRETRDTGVVKQALSVMPLFLSQAIEKDEVLGAVVVKLRDSDASTRMAAAEALAEMGDKSVLDDLKTAVRNEPDPNIRSNLEISLSRLEQRMAAKSPAQKHG